METILGTNEKLVPWNSNDAELLSKWFSNIEIRKSLGMDNNTVSPEQEAGHIQSFYTAGGPIPMAIESISSNKKIGFVGFYDIKLSHRSAYIGIFILRDQDRRQGIGSRALSLLIKYGIEKLGFHRISAVTRLENKAFQKLSKNLGFKEEGTLRDYYLWEKNFQNALLLSLIEDDFLDYNRSK